MSTASTPTTPRSPVDRAMRRIGDLDNPLYDDERARHVWYEASAIGFQALLWGGVLIAVALAWTDGPLWASIAILLLLGVTGAAVSHYVGRRRVGLGLGKAGFRLGRYVVWVAAIVAWIIGVAVHTRDDGSGFSSGLWQGAVAGALVGIVLLMIRHRRDRRREAAEAVAPDED